MFDRISEVIYLRNYKAISKEKALGISIVVTLLVMVLEITYSFISHSLMLFSDGIHMFTHALSLIITLLSIIIAKKTKKKVVELFAVTINGLMLFYFGLYIFMESLERLSNPMMIDLRYTLYIAFIGLIVNVFTALLLNQSGIEDLNTKSAFAHMIADTLMSISIVFGAVVIYFTQWYFIDALLSIIVSVLIMKWAFDLMKQIIQVLKVIGPEDRAIHTSSEKSN